MSVGRTMSHPRDIADEDITLAMDSTERRDLLIKLVNLSRETFGFYPDYFPYTISYPWIAAKLEQFSSGTKILDLGAGLTPLPLFSAEKGHFVDCVDGHSIVRTLPSQPDWNEWGFFDYGSLHANLKSHHCLISEFNPTQVFDVVCAVCCLAHMSRIVRRDVLSRSNRWLRKGGSFFLVIDLIPTTNFIWNISEGVEIEPHEEHGTVEDLLRELKANGFHIQEAKTVTKIWKSRTDLVLIHCDTSK